MLNPELEFNDSEIDWINNAKENKGLTISQILQRVRHERLERELWEDTRG
jgi:hypothetical protein